MSGWEVEGGVGPVSVWFVFRQRTGQTGGGLTGRQDGGRVGVCPECSRRLTCKISCLSYPTHGCGSSSPEAVEAEVRVGDTGVWGSVVTSVRVTSLVSGKGPSRPSRQGRETRTLRSVAKRTMEFCHPFHGSGPSRHADRGDDQ